MPVKRSRFSTFVMSKRTGKLLASSRMMTFELEEMKGPGGMLARNTVELYFWTRDSKKSSVPWL